MKKALIVVALVVLVAGATLSSAEDATTQPDSDPTITRQERAGRSVTRVVELQHISNQTAITAVRALFQLRQVMEVSAQRVVVFRDHPEVVDAAAELLKEIDVAPPRWTAEVLLVTGSQERLVRQIDIEREEIHLRFSNGTDGGVSVDLDAHDPGVATLRTRYNIGANLRTGEGQPALLFDESGKATFEDGDEFIVVEANRPEIREKLAETVGHDGQANALVLRFRKR